LIARSVVTSIPASASNRAQQASGEKARQCLRSAQPLWSAVVPSQIWLAAHWEKKLTRNQISKSNIVDACNSIIKVRR